ncbi:hypothetical protein H5410_045651 [Solanum commersonii]|uniref:Uncharacterized protein n=1 Tax=Solanum commersonii TaxID=4109 RepID=A0A9J5XA42_SOLCO|nr:hypothetical protein H5410_045651 [Solanum commersonii]
MSLGDLVLLRRIIQQNTDCSFHRLFYPAPSRLHVLEQRTECVTSARRLHLLRSFQPFCSSFYLTNTSSAVQQGLSNSAKQD